MVDFAQLAVAGLSIGAAYGLIAVGFVAIHEVSGIINIAQGEFAMLGGFIAISLVAAGTPLLAAAALAILAVALLAGVIEWAAIAPAYGSSVVAYIMLTLGIGITLKAAALLIWGPAGVALSPITAGSFDLGGVLIRYQELWIFAVTVVVALLLWFFFARTATGKAFRACAEQPTAARLIGISRPRMSRLSFVIAGSVGAVAGILVSPISFTNWNVGLFLGLKGFVAAALAGLASIPGALGAGLFLGLVESLGAGYISSGLKDAVAFVVLLAVLVARPSGVFARGLQTRV